MSEENKIVPFQKKTSSQDIRDLSEKGHLKQLMEEYDEDMRKKIIIREEIKKKMNSR